MYHQFGFYAPALARRNWVQLAEHGAIVPLVLRDRGHPAVERWMRCVSSMMFSRPDG